MQVLGSREGGAGVEERKCSIDLRGSPPCGRRISNERTMQRFKTEDVKRKEGKRRRRKFHWRFRALGGLVVHKPRSRRDSLFLGTRAMKDVQEEM